MSTVINFTTEALKELKHRLSDLPSFCRLVMYEALEYCDYSSGTIFMGVLDEVARNDFCVRSAPGRKKELVNADTLRNAFRSIKKQKSEHFKFSVQNQRMVIEMPFIKALYQRHFNGSPDVAAVNAGDDEQPTIQSVTSESRDCTVLFSAEDGVDDAAVTSLALHTQAQGSNNIFKITKTNKNKQNKNKQTNKTS